MLTNATSIVHNHPESEDQMLGSLYKDSMESAQGGNWGVFINSLYQNSQILAINCEC